MRNWRSIGAARGGVGGSVTDTLDASRRARQAGGRGGGGRGTGTTFRMPSSSTWTPLAEAAHAQRHATHALRQGTLAQRPGTHARRQGTLAQRPGAHAHRARHHRRRARSATWHAPINQGGETGRGRVFAWYTRGTCRGRWSHPRGFASLRGGCVCRHVTASPHGDASSCRIRLGLVARHVRGGGRETSGYRGSSGSSSGNSNNSGSSATAAAAAAAQRRQRQQQQHSDGSGSSSTATAATPATAAAAAAQHSGSTPGEGVSRGTAAYRGSTRLAAGRRGCRASRAGGRSPRERGDRSAGLVADWCGGWCGHG